MGDTPPRRRTASVIVDDDVWEQEVARFAAGSRPRVAAEVARREMERSLPAAGFQPCAADGPDRTRLPRCMKLYVPLGLSSSAAAPYGFVFEAAVSATSRSLELRLLAFGERHPPAGARSVYERAHKRLYRRYPD